MIEEYKNVNDNLTKLSNGIESFKSNQSEKFENYNKRLQNLENKYSTQNLENQRPILSKKSENIQYKKDLRNYLIKGSYSSSINSEKTGFPLKGEIAESLEDYLKKLSPIRNIASIDVIAADYITYVISEKDLIAKWIEDYNPDEGDDINQDVKSINIYTHQMYVQPKISKVSLEDEVIDVENWIANQAALAFIKQENSSFLFGDGQNKPFGLLYYNISKIADRSFAEIQTKDKGIISIEDLENLYYSLPTEFAANGTFLMNKQTIHLFRSMKYQQTGQYIWQPKLRDGDPDTLMGIPVIEATDMPIVKSNNFAVAFVDFKRAYKIIDRTDINILRDPYSNKPYIAFYITKRVGADLIDKKAGALLKIS